MEILFLQWSKNWSTAKKKIRGPVKRPLPSRSFNLEVFSLQVQAQK